MEKVYFKLFNYIIGTDIKGFNIDPLDYSSFINIQTSSNL